MPLFCKYSRYLVPTYHHYGAKRLLCHVNPYGQHNGGIHVIINEMQKVCAGKIITAFNLHPLSKYRSPVCGST